MPSKLLLVLMACLQLAIFATTPESVLGQHCCTCARPTDSVPVSSGTKLAMAGSTSHLWTPGQTIRVGFAGGSKNLQQRVMSYANEWSQFANVNFQESDYSKSEIRIAFTPGGSWSNVGTDALREPKSNPTMNFGWFTDSTPDRELSRTTLHEFGHALGLVHEHQNPNANIPWDRNAVYAYYQKQKPPWDKDKTDFNIFQRYDGASTNFSSFDRESIMLYSIPNELTIGNFSIEPNVVLSQTDKEHIARLYPGRWTADNRVTLTALTCVKKQEIGPNDEVHLRIIADETEIAVNHSTQTRLSRIPIFRMRSGESVQLGINATFRRILKIEIWEIDRPQNGDDHDLLGVVSICKSESGQIEVFDRSGMFEKRSHRYQLKWTSP